MMNDAVTGFEFSGATLMPCVAASNRDLKQAERQRDDGGRLVNISYCKESLSFTIV